MLIQEYIKNLKEESNLSYVKLAQNIGWNAPNVRMWVLGTATPSKRALEDVAAFVDPDNQSKLESYLFQLRDNQIKIKKESGNQYPTPLK